MDGGVGSVWTATALPNRVVKTEKMCEVVDVDTVKCLEDRLHVRKESFV